MHTCTFVIGKNTVNSLLNFLFVAIDYPGPLRHGRAYCARVFYTKPDIFI